MRRNLSLLQAVAAAAVLACGLLDAPRSVQAGEEGAKKKEEEPTTAERVKTATAPTARTKDRVDAIRKLGQLRGAQEVRDHRVVEVLLDLAKNKNDHMFVRMEAIQALGELQFNLFATDGHAKNRYTVPFIQILKDGQEEEHVKVAIARVFQKTLVADGLQDRDAVAAMLDSAEERGTPLMLRMACIEASGEIGSPRCIESYSKVLAQSDLDPLIKEATLQALCSLLSKYEGGTVTIGLPTLNRLTELVFGKDTPLEIRAKGLIVLARLQRLGVRGIDVLSRLLNILKTEENAEMVLAAVEALGIMGEQSGVPALVAAYDEFFDKANPTREADVRIRTAIVATLGDLLDAMGSKSVNAAAAKQIVELLLKTVDPQAEPKEAGKVVEDAIFALRYLFHKKPELQAYIQKAAEMLILLLRKNAESGELQAQIIETLKLITRKPFTELARWEKWYDETYPAFKLPKP